MSQRHGQVAHEPNRAILEEVATGSYVLELNDGTLRSTADYASALSNVNNVKISDLFEFLVM